MLWVVGSHINEGNRASKAKTHRSANDLEMVMHYAAQRVMKSEN